VGLDLVVKAAQGPRLRVPQVVLHEGGVKARALRIFCEYVSAKKPRSSPMSPRPDLEHLGDLGGVTVNGIGYDVLIRPSTRPGGRERRREA